MSDIKHERRARSFVPSDLACLALRARCSLSRGYASLRPCHVGRRAVTAANDPLERFLDLARGLAARFWSLID